MFCEAPPWIPFLTRPVSPQVDWHSDSVPHVQREAELCWRSPAQQLLDRSPCSPGRYYMHRVGHRVCQHER